MRLVFAGTPAPAVPALRALIASERHEVVAVLTRPDARSGRGRTVSASAVKQVAEAAGIEVLQPAKPRDPDFVEQLRAIGPDCCPVVAYGALLPRPVLDVPPRGWVNLHFSLLPAWRGAAPVQHAVLAGDELTGATTFLLEEGMDTGPVFGVVTEEIRASDTSGDLLERLSISGARLLAATLDGIEDGSLHAVPQPADGVSMAPKIEVADVEVDWSTPALRVDRLIRSATPAPGAWTTYAGQRIKLGPVEVSRAGEQVRAGEIQATSKAVRIGTATHPVRLSEVKPEGKGWMPATAWANGLRLVGGERVGE